MKIENIEIKINNQELMFDVYNIDIHYDYTPARLCGHPDSWHDKEEEFEILDFKIDVKELKGEYEELKELWEANPVSFEEKVRDTTETILYEKFEGELIEMYKEEMMECY